MIELNGGMFKFDLVEVVATKNSLYRLIDGA